MISTEPKKEISIIKDVSSPKDLRGGILEKSRTRNQIIIARALNKVARPMVEMVFSMASRTDFPFSLSS